MYFVLLSANVSTGEEMQNKENNFEIKNDIIEGRNAVVEALRVGRSIDKDIYRQGRDGQDPRPYRVESARGRK